MTTTNSEPPVVQPNNFKTVYAQKKAYASHLRTTFALADRAKVMLDGSHWIVRFKFAEILEHWLVLITFSVLSVSGLLQLFASVPSIAWIINTVFGGMENMNTAHHLFAIFFGAVCLLHLLRILTIWFVKREPGSMLPRRKDGSDLMKMIQFNLGLIKERPQFDHFTIEEKLGYWALLVFAVVMLLTGSILWVPPIVTQLVPAVVIQVARSIHSLTAILGVAAVLTWHIYFTVIKERNSSIFTGMVSEQSMKENHPLEYQRIAAAIDEVQELSKGK